MNVDDSSASVTVVAVVVGDTVIMILLPLQAKDVLSQDKTFGLKYVLAGHSPNVERKPLQIIYWLQLTGLAIIVPFGALLQSLCETNSVAAATCCSNIVANIVQMLTVS